MPWQLAPRFSDPEEVRPDLVLRGADTAGESPWLMVEVQGAVDDDKPRRWALAAAALFDKTGIAGDVVVITCRRRVARWVARNATRRGPLGTRWMLRPVVLLIDEKAAEALLDAAHPELALLAAWGMQHRHGPEARVIVRRAFTVTQTLPDDALRAAQERAIYLAIGERMRALLAKESTMGRLDEIPVPPSAQRLIDRDKLIRTHAEARGEARALFALLKARGLALSEEQRARILGCSDPAVLEAWVTRAATAATASEAIEMLFESSPGL